jgi:Arc/MetJ-type ribon-helix-helix transcriptional regulator
LPDKRRDKVEARLRKELDEDLRSATKSIDSGELSELVRNGLRLMLGIRTTKQIQITEKTLNLPARRFETNPESPSQGTKQLAEPQRTSSRTPSMPLSNDKKAPASNAGTKWTPLGKK